MENYAQGNMCKLGYWSALNESPIFNEHAEQAKKNKNQIKQFYETGPGSTRRFFPGRSRAQVTSGRITPLFVLQELKESQSRDQKPVTCAASDNPWDSAKSEAYLTPNYLRRASIKIGLKKTHELDTDPPPSAGTSRLPSRQSDTSFWTSETSTPLPAFPRRPPTDMFLYRRPTIGKSIPLKDDEELFAVLANMIDLKPLPFKKTTESYKFYQSNFPLLLTKITADTERCSTPSKRSRTPESPMSTMIARKRLLNQRLVDLEAMMMDMDRATEDVKFVTELYDPVFDPTTWPWNTVDVQSLRRRYTIDASLREM